MVYIVKQKINGKEYYYLRKSKREGNKVKSVFIGYLGKDKTNAEKKAKEIMKKIGNFLPDSKQEILNMKDLKTKEKNKDKLEKNTGAKKVNLKKENISVEEMTVFCKRKGFVYLSGEIYGGFAGFWDFGHLGSELKNNLKKEWWKYHVYSREDLEGIDGSIITHPKILSATYLLSAKNARSREKLTKLNSEKRNASAEENTTRKQPKISN